MVKIAKLETRSIFIMTTDVIDTATFNWLLGSPILDATKSWGRERRYILPEKRYKNASSHLKSILYHHHNSFNYTDELRELGYSETANALRRLLSGNPASSEQTMMGNLAEVIGAEYARHALLFDATSVYPKRFNPNIEQSMKGVDIVGLRTGTNPPEILIGEAKCYTEYDSRAVREAYQHLVNLTTGGAAKLLFMWREVMRLQGLRSDIDRVFAIEPVKHTLLLLITQNRPHDPFRSLEEICRVSPLPHLITVHIQLENLRDHLADLFTPEMP